MARRRGWAGDPPADDDQARERIVAAAVALMDRTGSAVTLSGVAQDLGVIRQTVYRYFDSSEELMAAAAMRSADAMVKRLAERASGIDEPAAAVIEVMVGALESVPQSPAMALLLTGPDAPANSTSVVSADSIRFGRSILDGLDVDWPDFGYDDAGLDELAEFVLRLLQSFFVVPEPRREAQQLRTFLERWVAPGIVNPAVRR